MALLSIEAKQLMDRYLSDVSHALKNSGHDSNEIESVVKGLEEQIYELSTRNNKPNISLADVEQTLEKLEPAEIYSADPVHEILPATIATKSSKPKTSAATKLGIFSISICLIGITITTILKQTAWIPSLTGPLFGATQITALAAGIASWSSTLGKFGAICATLFLLSVLLQ